MKTIIYLLKKTNIMLRKFLCGLILIADNQPTFVEKLKYFATIIGTIGPIAYCLEGLNWWFINNRQFAGFVLIAIMINIFVGAIFHLKNGTFTQEEFLIKNCLMILILLCSYTILEMLHLTLGDNIIADSFKTIIQLSTLLYPGSKSFKNMYILSNKQFPPKYVMERLYNFERTGNIDAIVKGIKVDLPKEDKVEQEEKSIN